MVSKQDDSNTVRTVHIACIGQNNYKEYNFNKCIPQVLKNRSYKRSGWKYFDSRWQERAGSCDFPSFTMAKTIRLVWKRGNRTEVNKLYVTSIVENVMKYVIEVHRLCQMLVSWWKHVLPPTTPLVHCKYSNKES